MACANVIQALKTTLERSFFKLTDTFRIPEHIWARHLSGIGIPFPLYCLPEEARLC